MGGRAVEAFLAMIPPTVTHNGLVVRERERGGRRESFIGKSGALHAAESAIRARLSRCRPDEPIACPMRAELRWCFPTEGRHAQGEPMVSRPDLDNLEKTFLDCCQAEGIIHDDALVVEKHSAKAWSDPAGIWFRFEEI